MKIHTYSWLIWLLAGLIIVTTTRNPLILLFMLLLLILFQILVSKESFQSLSGLFRFMLSLIGLTTLLNMITSHYGETILFSLPASIPLIGGNYTLESLVYGFTNGLILMNIFIMFTILNKVVSVNSLVRIIPQAFHPIAVVTMIALTFIPASRKQFHAIREAQAIRGQEVKKLRDWLPLIIPLLIGGLERAMQIAEAMTARGFSSQSDHKPTNLEKWLLPLALLFIFSGWMMDFLDKAPFSGLLLVIPGFGLLMLLFILSGKRMGKTSFYRQNWTGAALLITFAAAILILVFLTPVQGHQSLLYEPYPHFRFPDLSILHILAVSLLMLPLLFIREVVAHDQHS